jgi:hypothetical protein
VQKVVGVFVRFSCAASQAISFQQNRFCKFESKQAGLTFEFNESLKFEMLVPDGKKYTRINKQYY